MDQRDNPSQAILLSNTSKCKQCPYKSCTQIGLVRHILEFHNSTIDLKDWDNGKNKQSANSISTCSSNHSKSTVPTTANKRINNCASASTNSNEIPCRSSCIKCDVQFLNENESQKHVKDRMSELLKCEQCEFKSCTSVGLSHHKEQNHTINYEQIQNKNSSTGTQENFSEGIQVKKSTRHHLPKSKKGEWLVILKKLEITHESCI